MTAEQAYAVLTDSTVTKALAAFQASRDYQQLVRDGNESAEDHFYALYLRQANADLLAEALTAALTALEGNS